MTVIVTKYELSDLSMNLREYCCDVMDAKYEIMRILVRLVDGWMASLFFFYIMYNTRV